MRYWKSLIVIAVVGLLFSTPPKAFAGFGGLVGSWNITFTFGPDFGAGATQCLVFTKTSAELGEPNSGTWNCTTFSPFHGQWIQRGDNIELFGDDADSLTFTTVG